MREPKFSDKSEKSFDQAFDSENCAVNSALGYAGGAQMKGAKADKSDKNKSFINALKQIFLFLPGTFLLFYVSFAAAVIVMEIVVFRRPAETLPDDYLIQFALIGVIAFSGTMMTWFGLGDIKNRKHLAIPISIAASGAIIGAIVKALANFSDLADKMLSEFSYVIYLFPIALMIPVLAKSLVDKEPETK